MLVIKWSVFQNVAEDEVQDWGQEPVWKCKFDLS